MPEVKDFTEIRKRWDVMSAAMKEAETTDNFIAVDQALITTFNKITDPDSVVRESEYARTSSDLSLLNRLKGKVAKLSKGGPGLTPEDRKAISRMAEKFMKVSEKKYKERLYEYRGYLHNLGVDAEEYIAPYGKKGKEKPEVTEPLDPEEEANEFLKSIGQL